MWLSPRVINPLDIPIELIILEADKGAGGEDGSSSTIRFRNPETCPLVESRPRAVAMILHYVFIGVYFAAVLGIIFAIVHVSRQKHASIHRPRH